MKTDKVDAYAEISEAIRAARYHSISDLFGGRRDNRCTGNYANRKVGYRERLGRIGSEAHAHYSKKDLNKISILKQTFPNAYRMFEEMMEGLK